MTAERLTIGVLSAQAQCTVPTIRYYEQIGLLPPPQRAANGHRYYRAGDLTRLTFIRRCRDFGFPIEQVRKLAGLLQEGSAPCAQVRDLARLQLEQVRIKLEEMRQLESSLDAFVAGCDSGCLGGAARDCSILGDIAASETPAGFNEIKRP